ncbi:hypothetical protein [Caldimicrobium thiodismutans]|jgi:uncharacterized membrane protein YadS|uniref:hypothetical protein n=1 Tax=Caldimicrobium thiodismutans TaxID=1653476 RepID=UPI0008385AF8|nr:hypothetical protein [Caldimicrobium thiodismutans]
MQDYKSIFSYSLIALLWFLFSLRIYPSSLEKTFVESAKILFGSGLYALGLTIIINGLKFRFSKKSFTRRQFLRWVLLIALLTTLSASFEHYLRMKT